MFFLHASNKTENLLKHLAAVIEAAPQTSVFAREYIVIQSQGMERMISQAMADHFVSWCSYAFFLPVSFLQDIAAKLGMQITPDSFERNYLTWRIDEELHAIHESLYGPLQKYLDDDNQGVKRYQLARRLANVFDQYQLMRPAMLQSWQQKKRCTTDSAEVWQMHLWNRLVADTGGGKHRGELLQKVIEKLKETESASGLKKLLPQRVSIFGVHILPPIFLDYLNGLSQHCDVHLFLLSPCKSYWGDMIRKNVVSGDAEGLQPHHPLLETLGKQGRDFQDLLLEKVDFHKEITSYDDPCNRTNPNLLHKLQSDLLAGKIRKQQNKSSSDTSIRVVSCHSKLRELEVLKDHILEILTTVENIQLCDIVVMAPDIQEYAPFVPAVFDNIQHSIADRSLFRKNPYIATFKEFLALFKSRFGWTEVLDILANEHVHPNFGISQSDIDQIQHWVISSGIRWGLSKETRAKEGFDFATNSWQAGLERMLMGFAIDTEETVAGILPFTDLEGGDGAVLGGLCEFIEIIGNGAKEFSLEYNLRNWSDLLLKYIEILFGKKEDRDLFELAEIADQLKQYAVYHQNELSIDVIINWLEDSTVESRSASGFLKGQLTFCSMLPMRSIPFEIVCLLGLNHGDYPKYDGLQTFDLMKFQPLKGDRSNRSDDRYQFLEAILSARKSFYISYIGQSLANNEPIPPAVVVSELLDVLHRKYKIEDLVEVHPLHGFSRRYFTNESSLYSYSEENLEVASSLGKSRKEKEKWWSGKLEATSTDISFAELLKFYAHPQRYFVNESLGVKLADIGVSVEESESFSITGLQTYHADRTILDSILKEKNLKEVERKFRADGTWTLGNPGELLFLQKERELTDFSSRLEELGLGSSQEDIEFEIAVGPYTLKGKLPNIYERGIVYIRYANLKGRDLLAWWLHYLVAKEIGLKYDVVYLQMKDAEMCTDQQGQQGPTLVEMLDIYIQGLAEPSSLLLRPGVEYCRQTLSKRATLPPLQKARKVFLEDLEKGYEPEWSLLFGEVNEENVISEDFVALTEKTLLPLWRMLESG